MSRSMLSGIGAALVLCSPAPVRADAAEDEAAARVEELGGKVIRAEKQPGKPVVEVRFSFVAVTGADLRAMAPLQNLTALTLKYTSVSDADLKELAVWEQLTDLDLASTKVTDAGLGGLTALPNLTALDPRNTAVTDAGVKELQKALPACKIRR